MKSIKKLFLFKLSVFLFTLVFSPLSMKTEKLNATASLLDKLKNSGRLTEKLVADGSRTGSYGGTRGKSARG